MSFYKMAGCPPQGWLIEMRSSAMLEDLRVGPLLFHIKRNKLRWLRHLFQMPPRRFRWRHSGSVTPEGGAEEDLRHAGGTTSRNPEGRTGWPGSGHYVRKVLAGLLTEGSVARLHVGGRRWIILDLRLVLLKDYGFCQQMFCCLVRKKWLFVVFVFEVFGQSSCFDVCLGTLAVMITSHKTGAML